MCDNVSALNMVGFCLLIVSSLLCTLSFSAPFWIYYPRRLGVPDAISTREKFPFKLAASRGLWAVCYRELDLHHFSSEDSRDVSSCAWFWQTDFSSWKSIPSTCFVGCAIHRHYSACTRTRTHAVLKYSLVDRSENPKICLYKKLKALSRKSEKLVVSV